VVTVTYETWVSHGCGCLCYAVTCCSLSLDKLWCRAAAYIPDLVLDRPVFLRETADGLFHPIVYLGHKVGEEVRVLLPEPCP